MREAVLFTYYSNKSILYPSAQHGRNKWNGIIDQGVLLAIEQSDASVLSHGLNSIQTLLKLFVSIGVPSILL